MDNLDMTRDYRMWGNFFTFASKWSTGQARTLGGALGWKPLADLGGGESYGSDHSLINRIEQRQAQKLMFGGNAEDGSCRHGDGGCLELLHWPAVDSVAELPERSCAHI